MPASIYMPDVTVEIAFGTPPDDPSPSWTDVSTYLEAQVPIKLTRGRSDELAEIQPSIANLTLDNSDGRFTPAHSSSPYYPNVKKDRMIRVTVVWPLAGGTTYRRFTGYIGEWPVSWPTGHGSTSWAEISASSRRARLAVGAELPSIIEQEVLADAPKAYYPMGEPEPTTGPGKAGDVSGNQIEPLIASGSGAAIEWGQATGPGTDSLSAPEFTGGKYLERVGAALTSYPTDSSFTIEGFINTTDSAGHRTAITLASGFWYAYIGTNVSGQLFAASASYSLNSSVIVNDGLTHHIALRETTAAGTTTVTLFLDGVSVDSDTTSAVTTSRGQLRVGGFTGNPSISDPWIGSISHVAVFAGASELSSARIAVHAAAGLTGFAGDSSDERIERLAAYAGVPAASVITETGMTQDLVNQDTTNATPISLMDDVTRTEAGVLFDRGDGALIFHSRAHRYNTSSVMTLDAALSHLEDSLVAKVDGQLMVNDMSATSGNGVTIRVIDEASRDEHGVYRDQLSLLTADDNEALDAANWRVQRYAEPQVRITAVEVDLINQDSSLITALLAREIGDRITLTNLPSQAPSSTMEFFIDAVNETIGGGELYTIGFELTPAAQGTVWVLDSSTYSVLDSTTILAY